MFRTVLFFSLAVLMIALVGVTYSLVYSEQEEYVVEEYLETPGGSSDGTEAVISEELLLTPLTAEEAYEVILQAGIYPEEIVYFDIAPFDVTGNDDFEVAWAAVVFEGDEPLGTFVHSLTGELLATLVPLHEGFKARLVDLGVMKGKVHNVMGGGDQDTPYQYENYPWGYDLPTPFGYHRLNCGYGCFNHTGPDFYAVDLDMNTGECVPAPGSGLCMLVGDRGDGYGKQVIIQGAQINSTTWWVYRLAHFNSTYVVPGWWIDKNRTVGGAGCTGNCSGTHVHFSIHRGYYSGGRIYGGSIPLDQWPGPNDRVDYFDRNQTNQFSFNVCR